MAKSIRISDARYRVAHGASAQRARTQQVVGGALRARERALLKLGLADPQSMYLFPAALARKATVRFPELEE